MSDQPQLPLDLDDRPVEPLEHGTDLPLSPGGNSGNSGRPAAGAAAISLTDLLARLDEALLAPLGPPLHDVDYGAVHAWVEQAAEGLRWRRDRTELIREVGKILHDEFRTGRTIELVREMIASRAEQHREMQDGTYWQRRDGGRRAQQPTHVEVDPAAWQRAKVVATRQGVGIGEYVGRLIVAELRAPSRRRVPAPDQTSRLFARVAVEKDDWRAFLAGSRELGLTVQRRIGLIVERL